MNDYDPSRPIDTSPEGMANFEAQIGPLFDKGIQEVMNFMRECKAEALQHSVDQTGPLDFHKIAEDIQEIIAEQWEACGPGQEDAIVSGRLREVTTGDASLYEVFDAPQSTPEGSVWYSVDNELLTVTGPYVTPVVETHTENDKEVEVLQDMHIGFGFALMGEESTEPVAYAQEEDLIQLEFQRPTPAEAEHRLETSWPSQLELLQEITGVRPLGRIPALLAETTDALQSDLKKEEFRILAEIYLKSNLPLDSDTPYLIQVKDHVDYMTTVDDGGDGEWQRLHLAKPLTLYINTPEILFTTDDSESIGAYFSGFVPNDEYLAQEYTRMEARDIADFRSIKIPFRLARTADKMTKIVETDENLAMDRAIQLQLGRQMDLPADNDFITSGDFEEMEKDHQPHTSEYLQELIAFEATIAKCYEITRQSQRVYKTPEEAQRVADSLTQKVVEQFHETLPHCAPRILVEGVSISTRLRKETEASVMPVVDANDPFEVRTEGNGAMQASVLDNISGLSTAVSHNGVRAFRAHPALLVRWNVQKQEYLLAPGVPLDVVTIERRAIVPLAEELSTVWVSDLQCARAVEEQLARTSEENPNFVDTADYLRGLYHTLLDELAEKPVSESHMDILDDIAGGVDEDPSLAQPVASTLEIMVTDRAIKISGNGTTWLGEVSRDEYFSEREAKVYAINGDTNTGNIEIWFRTPDKKTHSIRLAMLQRMEF